MSLPRSLRVVTLLLAAASLGACTLTAIPRPMPIVPAPGATPATPAAGMAGAEAACTAAGRERGLDVLGVASARDVMGADGAPERDVMLQVARNGTRLEVRCNYQPVTGVARIMLI
ncbi:hypothetical protein M3N55_07190 [Roseibaca sp. V10]|uniref:Lipoprotein n=1 Tax=Roseinatronobacter domitianus TaxID=2940293 RepID=A0ABT0M0Y1_9RHOB|nr:hypothetical protein [Roseibaca domitiana]MCL1628512.1 hypothetical protein [Roseibaca domitiana]